MEQHVNKVPTRCDRKAAKTNNPQKKLGNVEKAVARRLADSSPSSDSQIPPAPLALRLLPASRGDKPVARGSEAKNTAPKNRTENR